MLELFATYVTVKSSFTKAWRRQKKLPNIKKKRLMTNEEPVRIKKPHFECAPRGRGILQDQDSEPRPT